MSAINPAEITIWAGNPAVYRARIENESSTYITQGTITSMAYYVYDRGSTAPQTPLVTGVVGSTCVYDTLQTDGWDLDTTGYNFKVAMSSTEFPLPDRKYRVRLGFEPVAGSTWVEGFNVHTKPVDGGS